MKLIISCEKECIVVTIKQQLHSNRCQQQSVILMSLKCNDRQKMFSNVVGAIKSLHMFGLGLC